MSPAGQTALAGRSRCRATSRLGTAVLWGLAGCLGSAVVLSSASAQGAEDWERLRQAQAALAAQQVDAAETLLSPWTSGPWAASDDPRLAPFSAQVSMLRFHQGRYEEAVRAMDRALSLAPDHARAAQWRELRELQSSTHAVTRQLEQAVSDDGRYVVQYPAQDAVLVPYAFDVLRAMDTKLGAFFETKLPGPLRLEIYPNPRALAQVSSLTVENIETSGTVALAKWNRLMVTSPRALVRGYPWMDTIAHELVHLTLSYVSHDRAPVWLQEGLAKRLERHWRETDAGLHMHPASQMLLARAVKNQKLLSFEQLHPSIALLPSQEDAALAFAQVATFVDIYLKQHGRPNVLRALRFIVEGADAKDALARAAELSWEQLERRWRKALPEQMEAPAITQLERRFRGSGPVDESQDVEAERAKRFLRLGDLLWDRRRISAAAIEYGKAHQAAPQDPILAARLARAQLASGQPAAAERSVEAMIGLHPEHAPSQAMLGAARLAQDDVAGARAPLREAIRLNPFDPQPHCDLANAAEDPSERARERDICRKLAR